MHLKPLVSMTFAVVCASACSATDPAVRQGAGGSGANAGETSGGGQSGDGMQLGGSGGGITAPGQDGGGDDDTCASDRRAAKPTQVDVYVMLDQSGSMTQEGDRWNPVSTAL